VRATLKPTANSNVPHFVLPSAAPVMLASFVSTATRRANQTIRLTSEFQRRPLQTPEAGLCLNVIVQHISLT
jgi:hypothetical protein